MIDAFSILRNRSQEVALRTSSALLLGMAWGLAPCAMVYNALITAMLSGRRQPALCSR
ncbi:urease accessory protein UreH domain-containing protein [Rhizobium ruizarguesonis]|uniref:urease accessory protein UreH domain-containing protein n=1 Tax=Rhizobium ruizarguesonis TaxID=2081791 RepID=UPI0038579A25